MRFLPAHEGRSILAWITSWKTRRDMLETYAKALEGGRMPLDAEAKVLAGRMEADKAFRGLKIRLASRS